MCALIGTGGCNPKYSEKQWLQFKLKDPKLEVRIKTKSSWVSVELVSCLLYYIPTAGHCLTD